MNEVALGIATTAPAIDYGCRLRAGLIVPSGNGIAEPEVAAMLPRGVLTLVTRLSLKGTSQRALIGMIDSLEAASELLADAGVEVIVFHCTAVSTFAPDLAANIRERIERATGVRAFATSDALVAALLHLQVQRIALLTPYTDEVHAREIAFFAAQGIEVVSGSNPGMDSNSEMAALEPGAILAWAGAHAEAGARKGAEAYFLSCTAIRSAPCIALIEALTGKPVITSNQGMMWHLLRTSGIADPVPGFGRLLTAPGGHSSVLGTARAVVAPSAT